MNLAILCKGGAYVKKKKQKEAYNRIYLSCFVHIICIFSYCNNNSCIFVTRCISFLVQCRTKKRKLIYIFQRLERKR